MIKSEEVMIVWTPNRPPFDGQETAGTAAITKIPEEPSLKAHPISVGACDHGWKQASISDRREKVREWRKQMIEEDNIPVEHADAVLSDIDWN